MCAGGCEREEFDAWDFGMLGEWCGEESRGQLGRSGYGIGSCLCWVGYGCVRFIFKSALGREERKSEGQDREGRIFREECGDMTAVVLESFECETRRSILKDRSCRAARNSGSANIRSSQYSFSRLLIGAQTFVHSTTGPSFLQTNISFT